MRVHRRFMLALVVVSGASRVYAGQQHVADLSALVRSADAVVLSRCDTPTSSWTGDPPIIVTRHACRIEQTFKGDAGAAVTVQTLGGRVGDVTMSASAGATLTAGTDFVLLLQRSTFGDYYVVAGGADGALPVSGAYAQRVVSGMSLDNFARWVHDASRP